MTTEKLTMKTTNMADENFRKLQELFPEAVTEIEENGKIVRAIDKDKLQQLISTSVVEGSKERYQFTWPGKRDAILLANTPTNKTLRPVKGENKTDDACFNTTENLYIEGDNLEVLKLLQEKYLGKIKMIYIDPPYNTGNDFIYKDNFAQNAQEYVANSGQTDEEGNRLVKNVESNGRFHSDWLSMMYPRLKIARNLLADDGVIFISIDDNEQENLKKLCDEILGTDNYVLQIAWRRSDNQPNVGKSARVKEYIICYCKQFEKMDIGRLPLSEKALNEYRYHDEKGAFRRGILLHKTRGRHIYPVKTKSGNILNGPWMIKEEELKKLDQEGLVYWTTGGDEQPYSKIYLSDSNGQIPCDFWGIEFGTNQRASLEVEALFNSRYFDFPKPVSLLKIITGLGCSNKNSIILDFFSGSATTAHAIMQLNAEDGGNRKFIMVQLPEVCDEKSEAYKAGYNTICDIGKERIRRAGAKIKEELEKTNPERAKTLDTGFRVLRLDSSNMKDVFYRPVDLNRDKLMDFTENVKEDRNEMDLLFQIMPELNADYTSKIEETYEDGKKIFNVESNYIVACFAESISEKVIRKVASYKPDYAVFRDSCFSKDSDLANVEQIFRAESPETKLRIL